MRTQLILLTAIIACPAYSHVLMPMPYGERQEAAQIIVIGEALRGDSQREKPENVIEFKVLATLKGKSKPTLKVSQSTAIVEEKLNCCKESGRYILFLRRIGNNLYESVNGNYGVVQLVE